MQQPELVEVGHQPEYAMQPADPVAPIETAVAAQGTPMSPEQVELMKGLIETIEADPTAEPFTEAVNWEDLELMDYPEVIKRPMDLGTLKSNLIEGQYTTFEACFTDLQLIWDNCKTYNYSADMYKLAERMERCARREMTKFLQEHNLNVIIAPSSPILKRKRSMTRANRPAPEKLARQASGATYKRAPVNVSTDMKMQLVAKIKKLGIDDIQKLVVFVSQLPSVSAQMAGEHDTVRIRIDNFDGPSYRDVREFVEDILVQRDSLKRQKLSEAEQPLKQNQ